MIAATTHRVARQRQRRRGLTLWEVMLALAILGGSIAVIGQLVRLGVRSAGEARDLAQAQLLCEAKLAELSAGMEPLQGIAAAPFPYEVDWLYSVEVLPVDQAGLLAVRVTVEKLVENQAWPLSFSLQRWIIDPSLEFQQAEMEAAEGEQTGEPTEPGASSSTSASSPASGSSGATP